MLKQIIPEKDLWPFLKRIDVELAGHAIGMPDDIVDEWSMVKVFTPNTNFAALGAPLSFSWGFSFLNVVNIVISGGEHNVLLMYDILSMSTKADVVLKKDDIFCFIDPHFNRMINEERRRRLAHKSRNPR